MNTTINYYNNNAKDFAANTQNADMTSLYEEFLAFLPDNGTILDCGCGSGRDTKFFSQQGYNVTAIDGSTSLCQIAQDFSGQQILCMSFDQIPWENKFDGIWACASLLHLPKNQLPSIFLKLSTALHPGGHLYCSFKYGDYEGERNGRYFSDLTEITLDDIIRTSGLTVVKQWQTEDVRPERNEIWLNTILVKKELSS